MTVAALDDQDILRGTIECWADEVGEDGVDQWAVTGETFVTFVSGVRHEEGGRSVSGDETKALAESRMLKGVRQYYTEVRRKSEGRPIRVYWRQRPEVEERPSSTRPPWISYVRLLFSSRPVCPACMGRKHNEGVSV